MKLLKVSHYYGCHGGGIELVAGHLALGLARRGVEVTWAASGPGPEDGASPVAFLPMRSSNLIERLAGFAFPIWDPPSLFRLARAVAASDVVHLHDTQYIGNLVAYAAAKLLSRPLVVTQHNGHLPHSGGSGPVRTAIVRLASKCYDNFNKMTLSRSDLVVFTSEELQRFFGRFVPFPGPTCCIPNGFDSEIFRPAEPSRRVSLRAALGWPSGSPVILFVGRFVERKGLPILRHLAATLPDVHWSFVGWGRDDPGNWGLTNVSCHGKVDHAGLAPYYQAADLLIVPSLIEGGSPPLVVREAMACGTPVLLPDTLAAAVPGIDRAALVCPLSRSSIAGLISKALAVPGLLDSLRADAERFARAFPSWDMASGMYLDRIKQLIK